MKPIALTIVQTHPVQYMAPWFRHIAVSLRDSIDLTVLYASQPTGEQQGVGFNATFEWDTPLLDGYRSVVVRPPSNDGSARFGTSDFKGLDVPEIGQALIETHPDVVLVPGWYSISLVRALGACRRRGIPVLYRGDTHMDMGPTGWRQWAWRLKTRGLLRLYDAYLSVGRRSREYLEMNGAAPEKIFASPHAIDNAQFADRAAAHTAPEPRRAARATLGCSDGDFVVLCAGKLTGRKRVADAIDAVAGLGRQACLVVAGAGDAEEALRARAAERDVRVAWLGFVNQQQMPRLYAAADCLAMPSDHESWGLVVNEAQATGLPAVVSDRAGCAPDLIVPGVSGEIYPQGDVDALRTALARVRDGGGRSRAAVADGPIARHSFAEASLGLLAACESVAKTARSPTRVIACCGGMVIVSGLERMTFEVLRAVRERADRVHCIVNGWENHRIVPLAESMGATWSTGFYGHTFTRRPRSIGQVAAMSWDVVRTSAGLMGSAVRVRPSHILLPEYLAAVRNLPALLLLRLFGVIVVLRLGNAPDQDRFYRVLWRWIVNPLVDRFICNSAFTERELLSHGISPAKVSRIYNTIPPRAPVVAAEPHDDHRVVYVGQIIPGKGLDVLLDALGLLRAKGVPATLDVVGTMTGWESPTFHGYRERLLARSGQPDLAGSVRFLGWREDVGAVFQAAAVHCCPSQPELREAFGVVTLEAKASGLPSVVTPVGGLPELVAHRVDGWVAADCDAPAIAEGLEYFLTDPGCAARAGDAARASASRFARSRFAADWQVVFA